ncbi:hypothetical protein [Fictibacillus sp. KU28468]|nr:hypothetical protein [Fictibacillus sp. KU28468]UZJ78458.1 hypothetical protein OKX00_20405 [Fictibacillus sp. KU28468]
MISVPGCSLLPARAPTSAGRAVSLTGVNPTFWCKHRRESHL